MAGRRATTPNKGTDKPVSPVVNEAQAVVKTPSKGGKDVTQAMGKEDDKSLAIAAMPHVLELMTVCIIAGLPFCFYYAMTAGSATSVRGNSVYGLVGMAIAVLYAAIGDGGRLSRMDSALVVRILLATGLIVIEYGVAAIAAYGFSQLRLTMVGVQE